MCRERCGQPTKKGTPCRLPVPCPTHSLTPDQLADRNKRAAQAAVESNPDFVAHLRKQAPRGFEALVKKVQRKRKTSYELARLEAMGKVCQAAAKRREENPSGPEQQMIDMLDFAGITYEREWKISDRRLSTIDFVIHSQRLCIEVTSFNEKWFGWSEYKSRIEDKRAMAEALGYDLVLIQF